MNFINPYQLLGVNPNMPDLKQLKKSYYQLALLCHPDKGGKKESMDIVHKCYLYIKKQFVNCQNVKTYEELEKEFADFCKTQEEQPPPFREIWENSEEYDNLKKFNEEFDKQQAEFFKECDNKNKEGNDTFTNCFQNFQKGYGQYMDISEYHTQNSEDIQKIQENTTQTMPMPTEKNKHEFTTSLIIYEEPTANPVGYGQHYRYDVNKVNDFTDTLSTSNITLNDYKKAFSKETNSINVDEIINNRPKTLEELQIIRQV